MGLLTFLSTIHCSYGCTGTSWFAGHTLFVSGEWFTPNTPNGYFDKSPVCTFVAELGMSLSHQIAPALIVNPRQFPHTSDNVAD